MGVVVSALHLNKVLSLRSVVMRQGAAVLRAQLGDFKQAADLLEKLSVSKPLNKDIWRLLVRLIHSDTSNSSFDSLRFLL